MSQRRGRGGPFGFSSRLGGGAGPGQPAGGAGGQSSRGRKVLRGGKAGRRISDKEADVSMPDSPASSGSGSSRFKPYGGGRILKRQRAGVKVVITGHSGGAWEDFIKFLRGRTPAPVVLKQVEHIGTSTVVTTETAEQAEVLVNLSGLKFAGNLVYFKVAASASHTPGSPRSQPGSSGKLDTIRQVLTSRYNSATNYLNLDAVINDSLLLSEQIRPFQPTVNGSQVSAVFLKMAGDMFPELETLSLARNRLRNAYHLKDLAFRLPKLKNLSLKDNNIGTYKDLEPLSGPAGSAKFKNLRELLLDGNLLKQQEVKNTGDEAVYRSEITRRFPSISLLDGQAVATGVSFDIVDEHTAASEGKFSLPAPIRGGFFDSPITKELAENFVRAYLTAYDSNRASLRDAYDPQASFSLAFCTTVPGMNSEQLKLGAYGPHTRNLHVVKDLPKRLRSLHVGNADIIKTLASLPQTSHSRMLSDPQRLCIDAWQLTGLAEPTSAPQVAEGHPAMLVHVHGEFVDGASGISRSFDRTFTLGPSVAGSPAQTSGWPVVILSDILTIRYYTGFSAWQPEDQAHAASAESLQPPPASDVNDPASHGLSDAQRKLVTELAGVTGLNRTFSIQCLAENAWNYDVALARFNELRAQGVIPAEAFAG